MISLAEARAAISAWQGESAFEVAGGVWKGKLFLHDIDLVVKEGSVPAVLRSVSARKVACPVELYIPLQGHDENLLRALRATTYEAIHGRLMKGIRFRKIKIEGGA